MSYGITLTLILSLAGICIIIASCLVFVMMKLEQRISNLEGSSVSNEPITPNNLEDKIATGLVSGFKQLKEDEDNHQKLMELSRRSQQVPSNIYNQNSFDAHSFNTNGDLIPENLTKEEQEILKMFYEPN